MEAGSTLVVDGADLVLGNLEQHGAVTVTTVNGGRILYGGEEQSDIVRPTLGGEFVKVGSGKMTMYEPVAYPSALHVTEGELAFSKYGLAQRYWKWTFRGVSNGPAPLNSLGKVWLYGVDGNRVGDGFGYAEYKANADLTAKDGYKGKATWVCSAKTNVAQVANVQWHQDCFSKVENLFKFNVPVNNFPNPGSPVIDKTNPDSYLGLEIRFKDADAPITGYNFGLTTTGKGRPADWTVEASDDGVNWTTVDVRSDVTTPNAYGIFCDGTAYTDNKMPDSPPAETFRFSGYLSEGLEPLATSVAIQVDEGAKLNLTAFTDGQSVNALTYDAEESGGEIMGAVFAANGTFYYKGLSKPKAGAILPYVLTDCSGFENLKTWSVIINGKTTAYRVSVKNGKLTLAAPGLFIVVK